MEAMEIHFITIPTDFNLFSPDSRAAAEALLAFMYRHCTRLFINIMEITGRGGTFHIVNK